MDDAKLEAQMPEFIRSVAVGLRTGLSLLQSLQAACQDFPEPVSGLFRNVMSRMQQGATFDSALSELLWQSESEEMTLFVTAVQVQAIAGGSLGETLATVAETVQERLTLKGEVASLTADGRWIIYILCGLTLFAVLAGLYMARAHLNSGTDGVLGELLYVCYALVAALIVIGAIWARWIINVRF